MLFKQTMLDRIARGEVTVAFRRWRRPTVVSGGRLRTPVGELAIHAVEVTALEEITDTAARQAGFADREEVLAELRAGEGNLYRIAFRLNREDPRKSLARSDDLDAETAALIREALRDLDRRSRGPKWTDTYLRLVTAHTGVAAADLAGMARVDKALLKRRMRRLKELGLTESLDVGYRLSPRGERFLCGAPVPGTPGKARPKTDGPPFVRNATAEDVEALAQIWMEGWTDAHDRLLPPELGRFRTLQDFHGRLRAGLDMTRVAVAEKRPVGFAMVKKDELDQLYVARDARGTGAALALATDALDRIRRAGHRRAWLACAIGNHRAACFYEKAGWKMAGVVTIRLDSPDGPIPLDVWRYEISVSAPQE
jgi:GNAT superfamily N-acetyltransferase